jgi:putative transposase
MSNGRLYHLDHCTYLCQYHLVWTCRYREPVLADKYIKQELKRIFKLIAKWKGLRIIAWHVGDEHIHLYLIIPPKYSVAYCVNILKAKSSTWLKKKTKKIPKGSFWARGYFISTLGINEMTVRKYIEHQKHHQTNLPKLI